MKLVHVRWLDAASRYQKWMSGEELDVRCVIHSAGILVFESKEVLSFVMDYDAESGQYRDVTSVPVSCILEKRYFKVKKKK